MFDSVPDPVRRQFSDPQFNVGGLAEVLATSEGRVQLAVVLDDARRAGKDPFEAITSVYERHGFITNGKPDVGKARDFAQTPDPASVLAREIKVALEVGKK